MLSVQTLRGSASARATVAPRAAPLHPYPSSWISHSLALEFCRSLRSVPHHNSLRASPVVNMQDSSKPLVVVGSINADLVVKLPQLPKPGETLSASSLEVYPGGKGANQAAAAAKIGYPTVFLGQVGSDTNAELLRNAVSTCGVDVGHLKVVPGPSGTAIILLQPSGENSIVLVGGANVSGWAISTDEEQLLHQAGAVLLQREIPEDVNLRVAQVCRQHGIPVFLDAGGMATPISEELLPLLSVISPNETELARLTGMETDQEERVREAAGKLLEAGPQEVLVKLGSSGSLLVGPEGSVRQKAVPAGRVVDTTGAGDCFTATYVVGLLEGKTPKEALLFASAAASLCVQRPGAIPSMPSRVEVEELLASLGT